MSIECGTPKFAFSNTDLAAMVVGFKDEPFKLRAVTTDSDGNVSQPDSVAVKAYNSQGSLLGSGAASFNDDLGMWTYDVTPTSVGTTMIRWVSSDSDIGVSMFIAIDAKLQYLMFQVKSLLDKAMKDSTKTYGYTDADLFMYILQAVNYFNGQPPVSSMTMGAIMGYLDSIIIDLACLYGVQSQMMHAVDSDVSYNDQGLSLTIDHFNKLTGVVNLITTRCMDSIKKVKWATGTTQSIRVLAAYNPERARNLVLGSQIVNQGFPYLLMGLNSQMLFEQH